MPFLLAEILNFQGSTHHIGVGSFSHLILYTPNLLTDLENSILSYLIPEKCRPVPNEKSSAVRRRTTYMEFYKENLSNGKALIQNINDIEIAIHEYLDLRFEEEENLFFQ